MNVIRSVVGAGVVGIGALAAAPAEAQTGFSISVGRGYGGYGGYYGAPLAGYGRLGGYGFTNTYGSRFVGRGYGYGRGTSVWHDTSHYDYYPGRYVPHGNHFDYVPGHYHWHNDGHWDHYGRGHFGHHHH